MNDIRAITIDLDDTLWEIHPVIYRAERRLYAWLGKHYPRITEMFSAAAVLEMRGAIWKEFPELSHDYTFMRSTVLSRIGSAAGYDDSLIDDALHVFNTARNDVELFPEVRPALESLRSNYVLIAVTNGNADLQQIGINDLFDDLVSARAVGAAKPARKIFEGSARDGVKGFPANVNVVAALALAGIGPDETRLEIWADPAIDRNIHRIEVEADSARFTMSIENVPTEANPRTGRITALSVIAALKSLTATLRVGT